MSSPPPRDHLVIDSVRAELYSLSALVSPVAPPRVKPGAHRDPLDRPLDYDSDQHAELSRCVSEVFLKK